MRPNRITCTCEHCGRSFPLKASAVAQGYGHFCRDRCRRLAKRPRLIECVCRGCGRTFEVKESALAAGKGHYCTIGCYDDHRPRRSAAERFWEKVNKDGPVPAHLPELGACWLWTAAAAEHKKWHYGRFDDEDAHRACWKLTHGAIPDGLFVLHRCDNPRCVRPSHLWLGTAADNTHDMMAKGRQVKAGRVKGSHLSPEALRSFREKRGWRVS